MKIFVTGASGFIGQHLIKMALARGHKITALRRLALTDHRDLVNVEWIDGTLETDLKRGLKGCDAIIHLAAYGVNPEHTAWSEAFRWNVDASIRTWFQAMEMGVSRFVIVGSCSEYGNSAERYQYIPTTAPLEPVNAYGASKAAATLAANAFAREHGIELVVPRLFHIYGEGEAKHRFWPSLRKSALTGKDFQMTLGEQIRDFTPVEFVADRLIELATNTYLEKGKPKILNLGTGSPMSLREFAEKEWEKFGATGELRFGEVPYRKNEVFRYVPCL